MIQTHTPLIVTRAGTIELYEVDRIEISSAVMEFIGSESR